MDGDFIESADAGMAYEDAMIAPMPDYPYYDEPYYGGSYGYSNFSGSKMDLH